MTEAALIAELRNAAERQRVSADAMRYLADAARRAQHLVFRELERRDATDLPTYEVGAAIFSPEIEQVDPIAYLHLIAKHRGSWVSVDLGRPGPRRLEMVRKRLKNAIRALGEVAPALADELMHFKAQCRSGKVLVRLPWRADSPQLDVS